MKKGLVAVFLLVFVGVGAAYFLFWPKEKTIIVDTGFAKYLPADTVAVVSLRDINGMVDNFPNTAIGKFLDKETMSRIMVELEIDVKNIQAYKDGYDKVFNVLQNPAFRMVFGDDVYLAVLPVDKSLLTTNFEKALRQSLLLMATSNAVDKIETFATKILKKTVEEFIHGSLVMTRIALEDGSFIFAYTDKSRLLVALEPVVIEKAMKQRELETVLVKSENFQAAVKFWEQTSVELVQSWAFVQSDFIRQMLLQSDNEEMQAIGQYLSGIHFFASVVGRNQVGWQQESMTAYSYYELDPLIKASVDISMASNNETLHLLSVNPLVYSWVADIGISSIIEELKVEEELYASVNAQVEAEFGVSLEKLLKSFGPQAGMGLNRIVQSGIFPLPELVFAVHITDREVIDNVLSKVRERMSAQGMVIDRKETEGKVIYTWAILPGEAAQPAIVLTDNMLYFSNGMSAVKKIIALETEREKLPEPMGEKLGAELSDKLKDANSGVFVFWPARLSAQLDGVANWAVSIIKSSEGVNVGSLKDEILRFIDSYEVIVFTSSLNREHGFGSLTVMDRDAEKMPEQ